MTVSEGDERSSQKVQTAQEPEKRLRLWPGVVVVVLLAAARFGLPLVLPGSTVAGYVGVLGGLLGGLAVLVWWSFFSRAPRAERWGGVLLMIVGLVVASRIVDESIATGMMGMMFPIYSVPVLSLAFVAWAVLSRNLSQRPRRATMIATILITCGGWGLVRTNGMTGEGNSDFAWRWTPTLEERLLARGGDVPASVGSAPPGATRGTAWPGFRGPDRDGVVRGVRIETDWSASPPVELWRRQIGPGWSSFAVRGALVYTQEQLGDDEIVSCYDATSGEPVWRHRDAVRFWESNAGAGPRATPTLSDGRVYTFGATGILNALAADDGTVVWSRDTAADPGARERPFGFTSSPLVVEDVVVVDNGALAAYDVQTGEPRWLGPSSGEDYSSPHLLTIDGVTQIVQLRYGGASGVVPADGTLLWEHSWSAVKIVQPALTPDGDLLIGSWGGLGVRRFAVEHGPGGWTTEERWTSLRLKPEFSDFVVHRGHAYGFDGSILACIDLDDGERRWKGGRYGHGQLVLLPNQDLLLVLTERGELALVAATPDRFTELARRPAVEGKTWNHPVLAGDLLLARNGHEMVAFRLSLAGG